MKIAIVSKTDSDNFKAVNMTEAEMADTEIIGTLETLLGNGIVGTNQYQLYTCSNGKAYSVFESGEAIEMSERAINNFGRD